MPAHEATTETETLVRDAFLETMDEGNLDDLEQYFDPSLDYYRSSGELAGLSDLRSDVEMFRTAFPEMDGEITRIISQGEKVSFLYNLEGTHEGEFEGIPPTNQEMDAKGAAIVRVEDGSITEYRLVFDNLGMLEQLGVLGE